MLPWEDVGFYGNDWKLIAELRIVYEDGSEAVIGTDGCFTRNANNPVISCPRSRTSSPAGVWSSSTGRLSVLLGNGWYKARFGFSALEDVGFYGNDWKLIAELRISRRRMEQLHQLESLMHRHRQTHPLCQHALRRFAKLRLTGFRLRYVKIEGIPDLKKEDFKGLALYSDFQPC